MNTGDEIQKKGTRERSTNHWTTKSEHSTSPTIFAHQKSKKKKNYKKKTNREHPEAIHKINLTETQPQTNHSHPKRARLSSDWQTQAGSNEACRQKLERRSLESGQTQPGQNTGQKGTGWTGTGWPQLQPQTVNLLLAAATSKHKEPLSKMLF